MEIEPGSPLWIAVVTVGVVALVPSVRRFQDASARRIAALLFSVQQAVSGRRRDKGRGRNAVVEQAPSRGAGGLRSSRQ